MPMRIYRPQRVLAGFHADSPSSGCPELAHCGEQWQPAGRWISDHSHQQWEFYLQLEGTSTWRCGRDVHVLTNGCLLGVPPGLVHGMPGPPGSAYHFFFASIDVIACLPRLPELAAAWQGRGTLVALGAGHLRDPFRQLIREVRLDLPLRDSGLRTALDHLLVELTRLQGPDPGKAWHALHPAVEECKRLLELHCERPWKLADLAREVRLSPNHLAQLFSSEVGTSPHRYLLQQRIEQAQHLLRDTDRPITDIALDLGFASSQHFARVFQRFVDCSATAFRQRWTQAPGPDRPGPMDTRDSAVG